MDTKQSRRIPRESIVYILICAVGTLAFILIGPYPSEKSLAKQDMEIQNLQVQIEEQKLLYPLYVELLKKLQAKGCEVLPFPSKGKLSRDEIDKIPCIFAEIVQRSELESASIIPDVKSIASNPGLILTNALVKGDFLHFRRLLIELGEIPYLEHIQEIEIKRVAGCIEFRLKIWLALE